jgi:hypothetical protein
MHYTEQTWNFPTEQPRSKERVIIVLKNGGREQFATWNDQSRVFTNAGGTQFKPDVVKFWISISALPPQPDVPNQRMI